MTTTHAAAQAELTHAGREVTREEQDCWLKGPFRSGGFDPRAPISDLEARLLAASNSLHSTSRNYGAPDGCVVSEPGTTRHVKR